MLKGFWSYVHADDDADQGRISQLARDVLSEFEMITAERVSLFLDRDAIEWGDNWRDTIDSNLATTAFFVAVVTPRFFNSPECRREATEFLNKARHLGVAQLFLPLIYVDTPATQTNVENDDLARMVREYQWVDWTQNRFSERQSERYRSGVHRLASRLRDANSAADSHLAPPEDASRSGEPPEEARGSLDRLADLETALPEWNRNIQTIGAIVTDIGSIMSRAAAEMSLLENEGFRARVRIARRVANELSPVADSLVEQSNDFGRFLYDVDEGFRTIITMAPAAVDSDPASVDQICSLFSTVRNLARSADDGLGSLRGLLEGIAPLEEASRDLRPPLRRMRDGLQRLIEARSVFLQWVQLIDAAGIECAEVPAPAVD